MQAYFELRNRLAGEYWKADQRLRAASECGLDTARLNLEGRPLVVWGAILRMVQDDGRIDALRAFVDRENDTLTPLVDAYAAEMSQGGAVRSDLPELPQISPDEIDAPLPEAAAPLMIPDELPRDLIALALRDETRAGGEVTPSELDAALAGRWTREAEEKLENLRDGHKQAREQLESRRKALESDIKKRAERIDEIESARPPERPRAPQRSPGKDEAAHRMALERYKRATDAFQEEEARYRADRAEAPELRDELRARRDDLEEMEDRINAQGRHARSEERAYARDVERARDRDISLMLDSMLDHAERAFDVRRDPFAGFQAVLVAGCCVDLAEERITDPQLAREVWRDFDKRAGDLVPRLRENEARIARAALTGTAVIEQRREAAAQALSDLGERLGALPLEDMAGHAGRLEALMSMTLPDAPDYAHLEDANAIEQAAAQLNEIKTTSETLLQDLNAALGEQSDERLTAADAAREDARTVVKALREKADEAFGLLKLNSGFWTLVGRAASGATHPDYVGKLCVALSGSVERLFGASPSVLAEGARSSKLGLVDAESFVAEHEVTKFFSTRKAAVKRVTETQARLKDAESALIEVRSLTHAVSEKYSGKIMTVAGFSLVPVLGVIGAGMLYATIRKVKALAQGGGGAYDELAAAARNTTLWAAPLVLLISAAVIWYTGTGALSEMLLGPLGQRGADIASLAVIGLSAISGLLAILSFVSCPGRFSG